MKVVLLNHSDSRGGASVATYRLYQALRQQGVDARMLVMHRTSDDANIQILEPAWRRRVSFIYEHLDIYLHNGLSRKYLFKASIAVCGMDVHRHPWVQEADVVVLGWVNQGMLSLREISRIKAPTVWIMHDMWNLTGVCHHAGDCRGYEQSCGHCPIVCSGRFAHDMSWRTLQRKHWLYQTKKIHFVAVSTWLQALCNKSALLQDQSVSMITNPFDAAPFSIEPKRTRRELGLPEGNLVVMGAARLDDPIKGLDIAIDALNNLEGKGVAVVFFGTLRDRSALDHLRIPYVHLGEIHSQDQLADIYAHADVVLSTSHYETLGLTLIEGMASGCVPVTFARGGQGDIVEHGINGYIARYPDARDVAAGIMWAMNADITRAVQREHAIKRFGAEAVARQYIQLFNEIIK